MEQRDLEALILRRNELFKAMETLRSGKIDEGISELRNVIYRINNTIIQTRKEGAVLK